MKKLRVLDLFSGIGGLSLGLERTGGFETVAFCEIEPYPRAVLAKHWPDVPIYDDARTLTADALRRDGIAVDVICGGFPCQDVSFAGKRAGLEGERSGLWGEYSRLIGELRPRFVIVENVPGLLSLGMGTVLGDLAAIGYDAVWDCIPASAVGAPHRRDRVWIVAYAKHVGRHGTKVAGSVSESQEERRLLEFEGFCDSSFSERHAANSNGQSKHARPLDAKVGGTSKCMAHTSSNGRQSRDVGQEQQAAIGTGWWLAEPDVGRVADGVPSELDGALNAEEHNQGMQIGDGQDQRRETVGTNWLVEPDIPRVAANVKDRVARLKGLGNAVVPQIPELIGRAILQAEGIGA